MRIRLIKEHNLVHRVANKFIQFHSGTEMWACRAKSDDHIMGESLMIFNHSFITTFKPDSQTVKNKWEIIGSKGMQWENDMSVLQASYMELNIKIGK